MNVQPSLIKRFAGSVNDFEFESMMSECFVGSSLDFVLLSRSVVDRTVWHGFDVSVENLAGTKRNGTNPDGSPWEVVMKYSYGYLRGTTGVDGDQVDCFLGPDQEAEFVYVVHTKNAGGEYDEDKAMLDFPSADMAKWAFLDSYNDPSFFNSMTILPVAEFIEKVLQTKDQPAKITATEHVPRRELAKHEKKHDFAGHARRQDGTQTAIRRILGGALPGVVRYAALRISTYDLRSVGQFYLPFDRNLVSRIAASCKIAHIYGYNQVYAERYRATGRSKSDKPRLVKLTSMSAEQDQPYLIAEAALSDFNNWVTGHATAAHVDAVKLGLDSEDMVSSIIRGFEEGSLAAVDRVAREASRSAVAGGRYAAFAELQEEIAKYVRSEAMDQNTCAECLAGDGAEWSTLDDVDWSPGDDCDGADACRGQLMPVFEDEGTVETIQ